MRSTQALGAGGAFTGGVLAGFIAGWWLSERTGQGWWVVLGLMAGALAGGAVALRALYRAVGK